MNSRLLVTTGIVLALATTALAFYWLGASTTHTQVEANPVAEKAIRYWYDPMVPDQHFDKPGKSPFMDMQLVPKYAEAEDTASTMISPVTRQNLGLRTTTVEIGSLTMSMQVPGSVVWNQRTSQEISARANGIVERLLVRAAYEPVSKGQALAEIVAPEWNAAAQEYLALETLTSDDARSLRSAARNRLRVLGMDEAQIRNLRSGGRGIVLRAPINGVVGALMIREGQRVQAGMSLMTINGLDTVWVEAAIPQGQSFGVQAGMRVEARTSTFPGQTFVGQVEALLADIDVATRTRQARVVLDNPGHQLVPGMFVELTFADPGADSHVLVPNGALIATGSDTRVIVESETGGFVPIRVVPGRSASGQTEILEGLVGGERVVVSGQFLLDSEASLSGALDRLSGDKSRAMNPASPSDGKPVNDHDEHAGHDMPIRSDQDPSQ
jgi:membrane fusion protein, copper/silver efflux system